MPHPATQAAKPAPAQDRLSPRHGRKLVLDNAWFTNAAQTITVTLVAALLWYEVEHDALAIWCALVVGTAVFRTLFVTATRDSRARSQRSAWRALQIDRLGALVQGLTWGFAPFILLPDGNLIGAAYLFAAVTLFSLGAHYYMLVDRIAATGLILGALIPFAGWLALDGSVPALVMSLYIVWELVFILMNTRRVEASVTTFEDLAQEASLSRRGMKRQDIFINFLLVQGQGLLFRSKLGQEIAAG